MSLDPKLNKMLDIVIEHYLVKWEPIGSKFLNTVEDVNFAPSTIRKYLNILEKEWMVFQPYNSSGRVPTVVWLSRYIENLIYTQGEETSVPVENVRASLKDAVEGLSTYVDGVVVWFIQQDEYYYLWINNLLQEQHLPEYKAIRQIVEFVESQKIVEIIWTQVLAPGKVNYYMWDVDEEGEWAISIIYAWAKLGNYQWVIAIVWPMRANHKMNVAVLKKCISQFWN